MTNKIILIILTILMTIILIFGIAIYTEAIGIFEKEKTTSICANPYNPAIYDQVFNDYNIKEYAEIGILTKENKIIYYQNITQLSDFYKGIRWIEFESDNTTYRILGEIILLKITDINNISNI